MAKTSLIIKSQRRKEKFLAAKKAGKKPEFSTKVYNRCQVCGRPRGYIRKFNMCRICLRQLASDDMIMGLRKASW
jgi:small subunit ribosomal protein S14